MIQQRTDGNIGCGTRCRQTSQRADLAAFRSAARRTLRDTAGPDWRRDLPAAWCDQVIAPITSEMLREYEIAADRTNGFDENDEPCYCAFRYVLTELRSDDDDVFYEEPVYAESLTAWRLRDGRWLILRKVTGNCSLGTEHRFFSLSDSMPR
jgi:hypothetical protein